MNKAPNLKPIDKENHMKFVQENMANVKIMENANISNFFFKEKLF